MRACGLSSHCISCLSFHRSSSILIPVGGGVRLKRLRARERAGAGVRLERTNESLGLACAAFPSTMRINAGALVWLRGPQSTRQARMADLVASSVSEQRHTGPPQHDGVLSPVSPDQAATREGPASAFAMTWHEGQAARPGVLTHCSHHPWPQPLRRSQSTSASAQSACLVSPGAQG